MASFRQAHAAEQSGEARIGADVVERRVNTEEDHNADAFVISPFEEIERPVLLAQNAVGIR